MTPRAILSPEEMVRLELLRRREAGQHPGSISELARAIGMAQPNLSRALRCGLGPQTRRRIEAILGIDLSDRR